jgi:PAS domain S-box-containing protein
MLNPLQPAKVSPKDVAEFVVRADATGDTRFTVAETLDVSRMQEEVNSLCLRLGEPIRYPLATGQVNTHDRMAEDANHSIVDIAIHNALVTESEKRYRTLFDLSPVAVYVIDAAGKIQQFNRHAAELWGQAPTIGDTDLRFCGSHKLFLPDGTYMPHDRCPMATVVSGEIAEARDAEVIIERPDKSRVTVIVNIVPLKNENGDTVGAINCFYDISDRSRMEREIRTQAQELGELHLRKDEFLAMLSHELRNPLAPILTALQVLGLQKDENPQQLQARGVIERQVGQMVRLINDLMEISRITTGKVRLDQKTVSINEVVVRAIETTQSLVDERRHKLTVSLPLRPVWLHADADRMEQVLINLITNAAKYTNMGGHIWLTIQQIGDAMELRVRDSGIGISPELLPRVFDLFSQEDQSLGRSHGGLGIGLNLVQRLVELHGGNITVDSVLGQGSEFLVSMPAIADSAAVATQLSVEKEALSGQRRRVLVVDDNVDAATIQQILLEANGHAVRVVHNGFAVLEAALAFRPDVVLLDIGLPGLDGFEVSKAIRQQPGLKDVLLIAMTGYGRPEDRERTHAAGFDHHLVKPVDFIEVARILGSAVHAGPHGPCALGCCSPPQAGARMAC